MMKSSLSQLRANERVHGNRQQRLVTRAKVFSKKGHCCVLSGRFISLRQSKCLQLSLR